MGVFARLFRRSKASQETAPRETRTEEAPDGAAAGPRAQETAGAAQPDASTGAPKGTGPAAEEKAGADGVEIPKQQSSGAADSETGKGART